MVDHNQKQSTTEELTIPAELAAALDGDGVVAAIFEALPQSHRREYVQWVAEAKKPETRQARAAKALEMIRTKKMSKG